MHKILYLSRGPSGSGKSFEIKKHVPPENIFSTDDFWGPDYNFDASKLHQAHSWNKRRTEQAMQQDITPIGVDNTNITWKEIKPYYKLAEQYGYAIEYVESTSPWWKEMSSRFPLNTDELEHYAEILNTKNTHGVPKETLKRMIQRWTPTDQLPKLRTESKMKTFKEYFLLEANASSFIRFYRELERGTDPDIDVLDKCLEILEFYYRDYLEWYNTHGRDHKKEQMKIYNDYGKQWNRVKLALASRDIKEKIFVIDQGISQWHYDYPVVAHMGMEAEDEVEEANWDEMGEILDKLGKIPRKSPYKP